MKNFIIRKNYHQKLLLKNQALQNKILFWFLIKFKIILKILFWYSSDSCNVTARIFEKLRLKDYWTRKFPCYTFLTFFVTFRESLLYLTKISFFFRKISFFPKNFNFWRKLQNLNYSRLLQKMYRFTDMRNN